MKTLIEMKDATLDTFLNNNPLGHYLRCWSKSWGGAKFRCLVRKWPVVFVASVGTFKMTDFGFGIPAPGAWPPCKFDRPKTNLQP